MMMNADEVGKLLGLMALADNRKPPEDDEGRQAMIAFWLSMVGDLSYTDAAQAVRDHYRESAEWIKPAHIRRRVAAMRTARLAAADYDLPTGEVADDPRAYLARLRREREAIAAGRPVLRQIDGAQ
jgi:hypothetical protein